MFADFKLLRDLRKRCIPPNEDWREILRCSYYIPYFLFEPFPPTYDSERDVTIPVNSLAIGGDGCGGRFAFLVIDPPASTLPVVYCNPKTLDCSHMILGESFRDFLDLCVPTGPFIFDEVAAGFQTFLEEYLEAWKAWPNNLDEPAHDFQPLVDHFGLKPWPEVSIRLAELNLKYLPLVRRSPFYSDADTYPVEHDLAVWQRLKRSNGNLKKVFRQWVDGKLIYEDDFE